MHKLTTVTVRLAVAALNNRQRLLTRLHEDPDRGSSTVETIIIVAGFAGLAFTVYLTASEKVEGWIDKIPGATGP
ncbi:hypothetical protein D0T12_04780 [Actinomadura spongiicola]|uniref:Uncharacterized protein n=1 Tax=Actinomadura spongiicola TaxID=2303421 RepID=A0A372GKQ0_9ACTN|nr:hypothetical protein [Actinomadura spongiicola]RFS85957.1 hypothetical protein D0T12_04780 [Actinomadura spongiicola]